jgi:hypothetical protein
MDFKIGTLALYAVILVTLGYSVSGCTRQAVDQTRGKKFVTRRSASARVMCLSTILMVLKVLKVLMVLKQTLEGYQRIFISHILSKNREKGYSPILFLSGICLRI